MKRVGRGVRKVIALLLTFIILLPILLFDDMKVVRDLYDIANADHVTSGNCGAAGDNVTWEYDDGALRISGSGMMKDYDSSYSAPWNSFRNKIESVVISGWVTYIGNYAFLGCTGLTEIIVDTNNEAYASESGVLFNKDKTELICYPAGKEGSYAIPESVTGIEDYAFLGCTGLTEILVDTNNEAYASEEGVLFNKDKTRLICYPAGKESDDYSIPEGVTDIGGHAFRGCGNLTEILVDEGNTAYASEAGVLFNKDKTKLICYPGGRESGAYSIPEGVTGIDAFAFSGCDNLTSVSIPTGITDIDNWAFDNCSSLKDVYYFGTEEQWKGINILFLEGNEHLLAADLHCVAAGSLTGILLDMTTASANVGDNITLTPVFVPDTATNKNVVWSVSDESIATVDNNGNVTGLKPGNVTISVTAEDGGHTASCTITVECTHVNTTEHAAMESTCTVQGNGEYVSCDDCGEIINGSDEKIPFKTHLLTKHERVEPDHFTGGTSEYYKCDECAKLFSDAEGKYEIAEADIAIFPIEHTYADTWSYDETEHWHECACGDKAYVSNHEYTNACDEICNECGYVRTVTHDYATGWSYDTAGHWHECVSCGVAHGELGEHVNVEKADEQYLKSAADCSHAAVYYKSCEVCGRASAEIFEYGNVDSDNHTVSDWKMTGSEHYMECTVCGAEIEGSRAGHISGNWIIDMEASVTDTGSKHKECAVCKKIMVMEKIDMLVEYKIISGGDSMWSEEGSISFRADVDFNKFEGVRVDGRLIDAGNYEAGEGSTIVTLNEEYLRTLSAGVHDITIVSSDGEAKTTFEVKKQAEPADVDATPQLRDNDDVLLIATILIIVGMFAAFIIFDVMSFLKNKKSK